MLTYRCMVIIIKGVIMQKELTEIQKNILDFLIDQIKGKGIPPTLADVSKTFWI